jgi:phosphate transport system protein
MNEHLSKQFDADLEQIRTRILQMGGLVEQQVAAAIAAFASGDLDDMSRVIDADHEVDALEVSIDEDCTLLIARRQPTAGDLRLVMAISRIVTDLERIGDKAAKIARMSINLYRAHRMGVPRLAEVRSCGEAALALLRRSLDALARMDGEAARAIIGEDAQIDEQFNGILRQLITYMMEDPRTITEALDIIWIAKAVERVGDHAVNVAENVIYVVTGTDVRHSAAGGIKRDNA